jgi:hypothetical protein
MAGWKLWADWFIGLEGVGVGQVALFGVSWPVGRKPVGTSCCIHHHFAQESVVCDGGGTECTAVHMELEILFCWSGSVV